MSWFGDIISGIGTIGGALFGGGGGSTTTVQSSTVNYMGASPTALGASGSLPMGYSATPPRSGPVRPASQGQMKANPHALAKSWAKVFEGDE